MNQTDNEKLHNINSLGDELFELMKENNDNHLINEFGQPHEYIQDAIKLWLSQNCNEKNLNNSVVLEIALYFTSSFQPNIDGSNSSVSRNIANVGYYQRGRDYQWEPDDLEPGHWEDHMQPPDWMVGD